MRSVPRLVLALAAVGSPIAALLPACGGGGSPGPDTGSTTSSGGGSRPSIMSSSSAAGGASSSASTSTASASSGCADLCTAPACAVLPVAPSQGACVRPALADGGEADAGIDDAGDATRTVCNPVTNAGCFGSDVCTVDNTLEHFVCIHAGMPASIPVCGDCSSATATCTAGAFCVGLTPTQASCVRLCCSDADCGAATCSASFLPLSLPSGVGVCAM